MVQFASKFMTAPWLGLDLFFALADKLGMNAIELRNDLAGRIDRLDSVSQIAAFKAGGYRGTFSFEPFATEVTASPTIEAGRRRTTKFTVAA